MLDIFIQNGMRIPAVLRGLEHAHTLKGKLPWSELVKPSVTLAAEGFVVSKELATEVSKNIDYEVLYGQLNAGDILKLHDLSDTLNAVAQHGTDGMLHIFCYEIPEIRDFRPSAIFKRL